MLGDVVCSVWARYGQCTCTCKGDAGRGMGDAHPQNGNLPLPPHEEPHEEPGNQEPFIGLYWTAVSKTSGFLHT